MAKKTGLDRRLAARGMKGLLDKRIVIKKDDSFINKYKLNKNFETWKNVIRKDTSVSRDDRVSSVEMSKLSSVETPTKDNKDNITKDIYSIIDHWNSKGVKILEDRESRVKKKTCNKIRAWLKDYSPEEIIEAVDNYCGVLKSEAHYFSHKWQLWEFLERGLVNFLTKNNPKINYLKSNQDYKPSQIGKYVPPRYTEEEKKLLIQIDREYKSEIEKAMKDEGWESEEDIDYFKIPTPEEFRKKRLKEFRHQNGRNQREYGNELL